jgi:drug/metabolite transporter (DMT)-like permease
MKKSNPHVFSYLAALLIGAILFLTFWKTLFGTAPSPVVIAGIVGVAVAVIGFLVWNKAKNSGDDDS